MATSTLAAYYYPGWHPCAVRDAGFSRGFSEWDLVFNAKPRFEGHLQPTKPLWGRQDESDPAVFAQKIDAATQYGIDLFVFAYYWSRRKRLLEGALDSGLLGCVHGKPFPFALMWANRMPRKVLPVKKTAGELIDPSRLVYTDPLDFVDFIQHVATRYFCQKSYFRYQGGAYLSIFDTSFFLRQMGIDGATKAISDARAWLCQQGHGALHLAAIDPAPEFWGDLRACGFDSVTNYVLLPEWKGARLQDFNEAAAKRAADWPRLRRGVGLPYMPSVSPGWDATPRSVDYGPEKIARYPWSPIVTGTSPQKFERFLRQALADTHDGNPEAPLAFVASWNEWSEGHYLEPDERFGYGWLEAVKRGRGEEGEGS